MKACFDFTLEDHVLSHLLVISYNQSLPTRPVLPNVQPGYLHKLIPPHAPQKPEQWSSIQEDIESKIVPGLTHWQSPNFMAFYPANVTYPSILGEMYSAAFTGPAFNWLCSPSCTELETIVMDWVGQALALPACFLSSGPTRGGGVIQGSASEAIVTVMVAARERYLRAKADAEGLKEGTLERDDRIAFLRGRLVALGSDQAHSSTQKAAIVAGTRYKSIPTSLEEGLALTGLRLQTALEECKRQGLEPYYLTTTLGTTNTCAIDCFDEIAAIKGDWPDLWVHVDAAYAGAALILPQYQYLSKAFEPFDSFDVNMSKCLLVSFDASCMFVRKRTDLTQALSIMPSYLQNNFTDSGLVTDYRDWQIALGRRFRALKIWFVMRTYGIEGLQKHIHKTHELGRSFSELVRNESDLFDIVVPPSFGLTCIRLKPAVAARAVSNQIRNPQETGMDGIIKGEDISGDFTPDSTQQAEVLANSFTKEISETINERRELFITSCTTASKTMIRVVNGTVLAEEQHIKKAFKTIVETAEEVLKRKTGKLESGHA